VTVLDEEKKVHIREFNQIDNKDLDKLCMNEYYEPQFSILPRTRPLRYKRPFEKVTRKWGIPISLFKDWFAFYSGKWITKNCIRNALNSIGQITNFINLSKMTLNAIKSSKYCGNFIPDTKKRIVSIPALHL